jgi:hypothetical protein
VNWLCTCSTAFSILSMASRSVSSITIPSVLIWAEG